MRRASSINAFEEGGMLASQKRIVKLPPTEDPSENREVTSLHIFQSNVDSFYFDDN